MRKLIAGAAGVALAAGVGLGMTQLAQAETPAPAPTTSASPTPGGSTTPTDYHGHGHGRKGFDAEALATKLGLPKATVSDALSAVREDARSAAPSTRPTTTAERDAAKVARQEALAKALAAKLNIDEARVSTALTELRTEAKAAATAGEKATLNRAVTDGTLTRTEADAVQKALDAGIVSPRGGGHGRR